MYSNNYTYIIGLGQGPGEPIAGSPEKEKFSRDQGREGNGVQLKDKC